MAYFIERDRLERCVSMIGEVGPVISDDFGISADFHKITPSENQRHTESTKHIQPKELIGGRDRFGIQALCLWLKFSVLHYRE